MLFEEGRQGKQKNCPYFLYSYDSAVLRWSRTEWENCGMQAQELGVKAQTLTPTLGGPKHEDHASLSYR